MLQDALRLLAPADEAAAGAPRTSRGACCGTCRRPPGCASTATSSDHISGGDAGVYDLLLNPRDRAFTVPQLAALLAERRAGGHRLDGAAALRPAAAAARPAAARPRRSAGSDRRAPRWPRRWPATCASTSLYCRRTSEPVRARRSARPGRGAGRRARCPGRSWPASSSPDGGADPAVRRAARAGARCRRWRRPSFAWSTAPRTVGAIAATLEARGTTPAAFARAWSETFHALEHANRLLLAPPP